MSVPRIVCDQCHAIVPREGHYVVKIEVYADPSTPAMSTDDLDEVDVDARVRGLLDELANASAEELEDAVYKRFDFRLCPACQRAYLKRPLPTAD